ncbi:MipA/OmpV family protein [Leptospira jelokensis]|uniref:MipA/OmpV family protein n=1 Tax=Leptospira jelokensis TaxID=2484931 RepID=A0A4Z0ZWI0_9LEPT|nr:MipA/OmpV family protein [Leptospira jelokensis]TGL72483.1 MipA/OmpV family protein [Leptospira jelokensis]
MKSCFLKILLYILTFFLSRSIYSNESIRKPPPSYDWTISLGIAPIYGPVFFGSRYSGYSIFPDLRFKYKDKVNFSIPDGLSYNFLLNENWSYGPIFKIRFGRNDEDGASPFLISKGTKDINRLGNLGIAGELGFFIQYNIEKFKIRSEFRNGVYEHYGKLLDFYFTYSNRKGPISFNFGPRISLANKEFLNHYFGINIFQFGRTGIFPQNLDSGLFFFGFTGSVLLPISMDWAVTIFFSYDQLSKNVGSSSLIELRGSIHQWNIGMGLGYRFGWND